MPATRWCARPWRSISPSAAPPGAPHRLCERASREAHLLGLDAGLLDDLPEFGDLAADVGVEALGARRRRIRAEPEQPLLHVRQLDDARDLAAQPCEQRLRRLRRGEHAEPG